MYNLNYFEKYITCKKTLNICEYELRQAEKERRNNIIESLVCEIDELKSQMSEIKAVIDNYNPNDYKDFTDERLFLRCRYVDGLTMEQIAEVMHVSRNTAYRIKRKINEQLS